MTDAPKLPPWPELPPVMTPEHALSWQWYYCDLAAAWEARCRLLYTEIGEGTKVTQMFAYRDCSPLPPKEET